MDVESVSEVLQHLPCLKSLDIWSCPKLKDLPEIDSTDPSSLKFFVNGEPSHALTGIPQSGPAMPLTPLDEACLQMDLMAIHEIVEDLAYKDDEGAATEFIDAGTMISATVYARRSLSHLMSDVPHKALNDAIQAQVISPIWHIASYLQASALLVLGRENEAQIALKEGSVLEEKKNLSDFFHGAFDFFFHISFKLRDFFSKAVKNKVKPFRIFLSLQLENTHLFYRRFSFFWVLPSMCLLKCPREISLKLMLNKFRSHLTSHSLVQPGENIDRFTLWLPEEDVWKQVVTPGSTKPDGEPKPGAAEGSLISG
ncbi:hypothetical protein OSB04_022634 [Centaurea solstitialis]|uniref:Serine/threonine-protein kinase BSK1-like TPR repeats domain-containing protein n=1 Tax=Centaurea solstitialis TaxID=347529 RepID=A0AA38T7T3_9ASTR|nr:hypothetical protein OSB04_022634 [Centaurea solstitialis]